MLALVARSSSVQTVCQGISGGVKEQQVYELAESAYPLWMAGLYTSLNRSLLVVTAGSGEARQLAGDLGTLVSGDEVYYFPPKEVFPGEVLAYSRDLEAQRMEVLVKLAKARRLLIVAPVEALAQRLPEPGSLHGAVITLRVGESYPWNDLLARVQQLGYARMEVVEGPGQFAVRGGLLDFFPLNLDKPLRLEFFGDELTSIRYFDPVTQRSQGELTQAELVPARELLVYPEALALALDRIKKEWHELQPRLGKKEAKALEERWGERVSRLEAGFPGDALDDLLAYFSQQEYSLFEYFDHTPLLVWIDPARTENSLQQHLVHFHQMCAEMVAQGRILPSQASLYLDHGELLARGSRGQVVYLTQLPRRAAGTQPRQMIRGGTCPVPPAHGNLQLLAENIRHWLGQGYRVVYLGAAGQRGRSLKEFFTEEGIPASLCNDLEAAVPAGTLILAPGSLSQGCEFTTDRLVVLTNYETMGSRRRTRQAARTFRTGTALRSYQELEAGDYVVHAHHGIGQYLGLEKLEVDGVQKDYLFIQYAGQDKLYLPSEQVGLIQKYAGAEGHIPRLSRLGSQDWARVKSRVKESVRDLAQELLQLFAVRETVAGTSFGSDTPWQREFEDAFPYEETRDQLRAIAEVKADMARPKPMDRLLCGDVGYGKTEVAMRAAFKAVQEGRQVAVLVPTTVLAQQHYHTFRERFSPFAVRVEVLSRFRSAREQEEVLQGVARGQVDIIIGTHRLLSDDVAFHNLGLLVIDEEQKFGVVHKEKIKKWRANVDVLTLSATPIPRTLHMALMGVRDMSVIETPPENRYPVQTYVMEFNPQMVQEAIRREMARQGQVYFVHNRVMDIDQVAYQLQQLVPEARIGIAHGQLREEVLEQVMLDFVEGQYDVLVCSSIVENGLDIPNVNTLIVNEADNLGLAQLYQLRGRVGRSNRMAYAYFTYRRDKVISPLAEKRLSAIREFTTLGSGVKIALRDLELRGAGNLLGAEQHGHMLAVGFDMYCQLLQEAIQELKGQPPPKEETVPIDINVNAYISDAYIPSPGLKMEVYQRLAPAKSLEEVVDLEVELIDRFGPPPAEVKNLLSVGRIKALAREVEVAAVRHKSGEVKMDFHSGASLRGEKLMLLARDFPRRLAFSAAGGLTIRLRTTGLNSEEILAMIEKVLDRVRELTSGAGGEGQEITLPLATQ